MQNTHWRERLCVLNGVVCLSVCAKVRFLPSCIQAQSQRMRIHFFPHSVCASLRISTDINISHRDRLVEGPLLDLVFSAVSVQARFDMKRRFDLFVLKLKMKLQP